VSEAVRETGANTAATFVPARFAADALYEAIDAGLETIVCITEGIPVHEMLRLYQYARDRGVTLIGPNCPGVISPGKANVGIIRPRSSPGLGRPGQPLGHADLPDRLTSWPSWGSETPP